MRMSPSKSELWFVFDRGGQVYREQAWRALMSRSDTQALDIVGLFEREPFQGRRISEADYREVEVWRGRAWDELLKRDDFNTQILRAVSHSDGIPGNWRWRARLRLATREDATQEDLWYLRETLSRAILRGREYGEARDEHESLLEAVASERAGEQDDSSVEEERASKIVPPLTYRIEVDGKVSQVTNSSLVEVLRKIDRKLLTKNDLRAERVRMIVPSLYPEDRIPVLQRLVAFEPLTEQDLEVAIKFGSDELRKSVVRLLSSAPSTKIPAESAMTLPLRLEASRHGDGYRADPDTADWLKVAAFWTTAAMAAVLRRFMFRPEDRLGYRGTPAGWDEDCTRSACAQVLQDRPAQVSVLRNVILFGDQSARAEAVELLVDHPQASMSDLLLAAKLNDPIPSGVAIDSIVARPEAAWKDLAASIRFLTSSGRGGQASSGYLGVREQALPRVDSGKSATSEAFDQRRVDAALARLVRMRDAPPQELAELIPHGSLDWKENDKEVILAFEKKQRLLRAMGCYGAAPSDDSGWYDE